MDNEKHEEIGWPTPEEEAALDRAALAGRDALARRTPEETAQIARRCKAVNERDQKDPSPRD